MRTPRIVCALLLLAGVAAAQTRDLGQLRGHVVDPTGAVIAGADVVVTNTATGQRRTTQSDAIGGFAPPRPPPPRRHTHQGRAPRLPPAPPRGPPPPTPPPGTLGLCL